MLLKKAQLQTISLEAAEMSRVIEMAWEDRTPFEAIESQFGMNQDAVIRLMRSQLSAPSFQSWRARTRGQKTKHLALRESTVDRHCASVQHKLHRP